MSALLPSFILAFHGCDREVAERLLAGSMELKTSRNTYDWLGDGVYFWENSPRRAVEYAHELARHPRRFGARIRRPATVGAIVDPGYCLNLLDAHCLGIVREAFVELKKASDEAGIPLPVNRTTGASREPILRYLDCAVINSVHQRRAASIPNLRPFDTVRAAFIEGEPLYAGAGFHERNHIQLCVRNLKCIKGLFRPSKDFEETIGL